MSYIGPCSALRGARIQESSIGASSESFGVFTVTYALSPTQRQIMHRMAEFYDKDAVASVLLPFHEKNREVVSLRLLDWLVTNYSKKHNIVCKRPNSDLMNIFQSYKVALQRYRRRNFDPFKRRMRITCTDGENKIETTVGQLNFLKWAHDNGVLDFAAKNRDVIENDMNSCHQKKKKERGALKRKELSRFPDTKCCVYKRKTTVTLVP